MQISRGAAKKDNATVVTGLGMGIFDVAGGSLVKNVLRGFSKDVLGHVFRNAVGHVNPSH